MNVETFLDADWQETAGAACRGMDTKFFYPPGSEGIAEAKAVCTKCPIKVECLQYALEYGEDYGIWGGETERARVIIRKRLGIKVKRRPMIYPATNGNRGVKKSLPSF